MKRSFYKVFLGLFFWFSLANLGFGQAFTFSSGKVDFVIKNAGIKVNGSFGKISAELKFDPGKPLEASIQGQVEVSSIETGIELRNRHLKKEAYFDAERFPKIEMKLLAIETHAAGLMGTFALKMKGVTKKVVLPIQFSNQGEKGMLTTQFMVNRLDFGVGGKSWTLADEVEVSVRLLLKAL